jgi:hypothetical protein
MMFLVGLLLAAFPGPSEASVAAVMDSTWTSWPNTVYYFSRLSGPDAPYNEFTVYITAVDRYALWINGKRIDTPSTNDNNYATIDSMKVTGLTQELLIAVKVENLGAGHGNGLLMDIKAGKDWLGTTTMKRRSLYDELNNNMMTFPAIWYYYAGDIEAALGKTDWYKFDKTFFDGITAKGFKDVIFGAIEGLAYKPDPHIQVVAGYYGGIETGSAKGGGISLRKINGENLCLKKPCMEEKLTDGNIELGLPYHEDPIGKMEEVFLEDYYRVISIRIYTGGSNPQDWLKDSTRGFSARTSLDDVTYTERGVISNAGISNVDNGGYDYSEVSFEPVFARFVRYYITESRTTPPHLGEVMTFGTGYIYNGEYISPWIDFGSPAALKNFGEVTWDAVMPQGTTIAVQTQTVNSEGIESEWSQDHTGKKFDFDSPEPSAKFRYKVKLATDGVDITPVFKSMKVTYSSADQPLISGNASILPNLVPMGVDTTFVYTINYNLASGQNIKTVVIMVPNYAIADSVFISDTNTMLRSGKGITSTSTNDSLYVTFTNPVANTVGTGLDNMKIYFRTSLLINVHDFESGVYNSTMNDKVGLLKLDENPAATWRVTTSSVMAEVLSDVKVVPRAFTPNKDGTNDFTVIEFTIASIRESKVTIKIFNTDGTLVTKVLDKVLSPGNYRIPDNVKLGRGGEAKNQPGYWDGTNENGDLVPPGIYIYQITVKTEDGDKMNTGTVAVAY